jgi:hypothetical protein
MGEIERKRDRWEKYKDIETEIEGRDREIDGRNRNI